MVNIDASVAADTIAALIAKGSPKKVILDGETLYYPYYVFRES